MQRIILLLFTVAILSSCDKEDENPNKDIIVENVNLTNSEIYQYDLGYFGFEEGASLLVQAEHYDTSELDRDMNTGNIIYKYQAQTGYSGKDYVEIQTGRGSDGASPNPFLTIIKITFTID